MLPERAEEMLKDYKACYGRCGYLREALEALRMDEKAMIDVYKRQSLYRALISLYVIPSK